MVAVRSYTILNQSLLNDFSLHITLIPTTGKELCNVGEFYTRYPTSNTSL